MKNLGWKSIILLIFACSSFQAGAQQAYTPQDSANISSEVTPPVAFNVPDENIDLRTGNIYFETNDFKIPGTNGMDILVSRSFQKVGIQRMDLGYGWDLEVPRLFPASFTGSCAASVDEIYNQSSSIVPAYQDGAVLMSVPGRGPITFLWKRNFPAQVQGSWVSLDKWTLGCGGASGNDWVATSPAGITYHFPTADNTHHFANYAPSYGVVIPRYIFYADTETDLFGNSINYNFTNVYSGPGGFYVTTFQSLFITAPANNNVLTSITSSDGREVDFSYSVANNFTGLNVPFPTITGFSVKGSSPLVSYTYNQGQAANPLSFASAFQPVGHPLLNSVTRPDGNQYQYSYQNLTPYAPLTGFDTTYGFNVRITQMTLPNGLALAYTYGYNPAAYFDTMSFLSNLRNATLSLTSRTLNGTGLSASIPITYSYYVNNFNPPSPIYGPLRLETGIFIFSSNMGIKSYPENTIVALRRILTSLSVCPIRLMFFNPPRGRWVFWWKRRFSRMQAAPPRPFIIMPPRPFQTV